MSNPVLVEVTRGGVVESRHRGALAVMDGDGRMVFALGDVERPVFPRSSVKAFQALPLLESGAADRFGFGDRELALAISSHNGEAEHVATARAMLAAGGLNEGQLACGPQWPSAPKAMAAMHRMGAPAARICNNCSGKHAGFLCASIALGADPAGYADAGHPLMRAVIAAGEAMTGAAHTADFCGTDGCSIPTYAVPLSALARGFARFVTGVGLTRERAEACARLRRAAAAHPFMVAGSGRFCTRAMEVTGARAFVKTGAEGVFTAALPEAGVGVAIKIDDGAARGSEVAVAAVIDRILGTTGGAPVDERWTKLRRPEVRSWAGELCGHVRPTVDFEAALAAAIV